MSMSNGTSIANGGRRAHRTESHAVRLVSRNASWQSRTIDSERRSSLFIRDRILFWVGLFLTRLRQGVRRPHPRRTALIAHTSCRLSLVTVAKPGRPSGTGKALAAAPPPAKAC
jgi:hypothetical protein